MYKIYSIPGEDQNRDLSIEIPPVKNYVLFSASIIPFNDIEPSLPSPTIFPVFEF